MEEKEKEFEERHSDVIRRWGLWRMDRPLPPRGCSWGFYVFLVLLALFLIMMFIRYRHV